MPFPLPAPVGDALRRLNAGGYAAYIVGGCVRDMLSGRAPHDYDICTSARPREIHACFAGERVLDTGVKHGTVTVLLGGMPLEITTFRADGAYSDGRHPDSVRFTDALHEDLKRRDFTINAMAYHPGTGVIDLFGGQRDLQERVIRCVGDAETRFTEDALRILRALRFAARFRFVLAPATDDALRRLSGRLALISRERVSAELRGILTAPGGADALREHPETLQAALPDCPRAACAAGVAALARLSSPDETLALAALLHACREAEMRACLGSLRLSNALNGDVIQLIAHSAAALPLEDAALALATLRAEQFGRLLALQPALGLLTAEEAASRRARAQSAQAAGLPMTLRQLAVNGRDLATLGISGPAIGETLADLWRQALREQLPNTREALLRAAERKAD